MGCAARSGIFLPPMTKVVLLFLTPFLIDRLHDLEGLIFILAWDISSSILFSSWDVHAAV